MATNSKKQTQTPGNGHHLIIVESPAKIKTISKFLGKDFTIMSTFGHVKDLPERKLGIEINEETGEISLDYVPIKGKAEVIANICKQASQMQDIYLASDCDREGEVISFHIGEEIKKVVKNKAQIYRIVFNEITKPAIEKAIANKQSVDLQKVAAQQARRILDRWVGYQVSPMLWKTISKGLSAGRVQSVAVLLVDNREREIENFQPEESWTLHVMLVRVDGQLIPATLYKIKSTVAKLKTAEQALAAAEGISKAEFAIEDIIDKQRKRSPLPPFLTSSLQQDAYNKLGFSVDKTMLIAQKLYEGVPLQDPSTPEALITYMRSDSLRLSDTALEQIRDFVNKQYGKNYLPNKSISYAKDESQDAHEAIRPVDITKTPEKIAQYLEPDFAELYQLIWRRAVACQMEDALYAQRQVLIKGGDYQLRATGSTLIFDGFLKVYKPEEDEKKEDDVEHVVLPADLKKGENLKQKKVEQKQHFTQPPARYTEASLVKEMEKQGIGRPSTYAATLSIIQKRNYVEKKAKRFVPTQLGRTVTELLVKNLANIVNVSFTAKMEEELDKIASGQLDRNKVLWDFYYKFQKDLGHFGANLQQEKKKNIPTELTCPACNESSLVIRFGRSGEFLGCQGFPKCSYTANFTREENGSLTIIDKAAANTEAVAALAIEGQNCPQCGKQLVLKQGRFGPFAACPGYPDCKYIAKSGNAGGRSGGGRKFGGGAKAKAGKTKTTSTKTSSKGNKGEA